MEKIRAIALVNDSFFSTIEEGDDICLTTDVCEIITTDRVTIKEMEYHGLTKNVTPIEIDIDFSKIGFMINWFMKGAEGGSEVCASYVRHMRDDS